MPSISLLVDEADRSGDLYVAVDVVKELQSLVELPLGDGVGRLEHVPASRADRVAGLVVEERAGPASVGDGVASLKSVPRSIFFALQIHCGAHLFRIQAKGAAEIRADVAEVGGGEGGDERTLKEENHEQS